LRPWGSSECLGSLLVGWPLSGCPTSSRNWLLAKSWSPLKYRPYGFERSRCAVALLLGFAVFLQRAVPATIRRPENPLFEFGLPSEFYPATPSRRSNPVRSDGSSHELSFPYSTCRMRRSTLRRHSRPATFRLQGFLSTLLTVFSLHIRAGSISHRQRSWDSPFGAFPSREVAAAFPRRWTHVPLVRSIFPRRSRGRLEGHRFLGFDPPKSPWLHTALLARGTLEAPLGLALLGDSELTWTEPSPSLPSHAYPTRTRRVERRLRVSIDQHRPWSHVQLGWGRTKDPV